MKILKLDILRYAVWSNLSLLFIILLFSIRNSIAQVPDSLHHVPENQSVGDRTVKSLLKLSSETYNNLPDSCLTYAMNAFRLARDNGMIPSQARALYYEALARNYIGEFEKATALIQHAIAIQDSAGLTDARASSLMVLGLTFENRSMLSEALSAHTKAYELFVQTGNQRGIAQSLLNIGCVLNAKKDYDNSLGYFKQALVTATAIGHKPTMAAAYNNMGIISDLHGKKIAALDFYNKALSLQESMDNKREMAHLNNNIALVYLDLNRFAEARKSLEKSIGLKRQINDQEGIANSYNQIAEIFLKQNNYGEARNYVNKALLLADTAHYWIVIRQAFNIMSKLEEQTGNFKKSIECLRKAALANDTLFNITTTRQIAEMQTRFETNRKEQENRILRQEIKIETDRVAYHRTRVQLLVILMIISVLLSVLLIVLFRQRGVSLKKTRTILEQEKQMAELSFKNQQSEMKRLEAERQKQKFENELLEEQMVAQEEINKFEKEKLHTDLDKRSSELSVLTLHLVNNNEILGQIKKQISNIKSSEESSLDNTVKNLTSLINQHIDPDLNWKKFRVNFDDVHPGFFGKLQQNYPNLSDNDLKICAFLRVNLQSKEIAQIMNVSLSAVNKGRQRLRKSLNCVPQTDLHDFLSNI